MNKKAMISKASLKEHYDGLEKRENFRAVATTISQRNEYDKNNYYSARPTEWIATNINQIMAQCEEAYYQHGILRSIIEFISEFIVDGLEILHVDPEIQEFYSSWKTKVKLDDRAERIANFLYRSGNFVVHRYTDKISIPTRNTMMEGKIVADKIGDNSVPKKRKAEIPTKYFIYTPSTIELVGDEMGALSDEKIYGLRVPTEVVTRLSSQRTDLEKKAYRAIPQNIKDAANKNQGSYIVLPLKNDEIYVGHYKKDDSQMWAYPLTYSILSNLMLNSKLRLAKASAFDNFRNCIRIWKLGDHKEGILPPPGAAMKLNEILQANDGGGTLELIWDSMLEFAESVFPVEKMKDFEEDNTAALILFGIPDEIIGGTQKSSGSTNSSLRLKNLAKKLQAGRREVKQWIEFEVATIHRNMGFPGRPVIRFKNDDLMDEKIYYTLLRELTDRNILSQQTMLERLEEIPEVERVRVEKEEKDRQNDVLPDKASPFHNPNLQDQGELEIKKIKTQTNLSNEAKKKTPDKPNGRPPASKDKFKRKRGTNKPKSFALLYASTAYDKIDAIITPAFLEDNKVKTIRELSSENKILLENLKFAALASLEPGSDVNDQILDNIDTEAIEAFHEQYNESLEGLAAEKITAEERKLLKFEAYATIWVL